VTDQRGFTRISGAVLAMADKYLDEGDNHLYFNKFNNKVCLAGLV